MFQPLSPSAVNLRWVLNQPGSTESTMLVVSDLEDVFLPKPADILLNLTESRAGLEALLGRIPDMFLESHAIGSALGPVLQAAYKLTVRSLWIRHCVIDWL